MKKLLSAALVVAATSVSANAADMSYKAPMAQTAYSWTGFYLGANAGGGIANSEHLDQDAFEAVNTKFQEAFGTIGLTAGYNYQFGRTVLGIEGDYNWANVNATKSLANGSEGGSGSTQFQMDQFATLRARAGLALDQTFIYATGGVAFAHVQNTTTFGANGGFAQASEDKWKTGLAVGAGIEFALTHNWSLKGEYMLMQFENSNASINDIGTTRNSCGAVNPCRMSYSESIQTARLGLNYKFGY
jgi:outer membrane immunogenic protein